MIRRIDKRRLVSAVWTSGYSVIVEDSTISSHLFPLLGTFSANIPNIRHFFATQKWLIVAISRAGWWKADVSSIRNFSGDRSNRFECPSGFYRAKQKSPYLADTALPASLYTSSRQDRRLWDLGFVTKYVRNCNAIVFPYCIVFKLPRAIAQKLAVPY